MKYLTCEIKYITPAVKDSYSFVKDIQALTSHLPKGRYQPCLPEYLLSLFGSPSVIVGRQAILVPKPGKLPDLSHRKDLAALEVISPAPALDPFLRLEEKHGRSGKDQIIIPVSERHEIMDLQVIG